MTTEDKTKTPIRWETLPRSPFRWSDESFPEDEVPIPEVKTDRRTKSPFNFDESSDESPENKAQTRGIAHRRETESLSDDSLYDGYYDEDETVGAIYHKNNYPDDFYDYYGDDDISTGSTDRVEGTQEPNIFPSPPREVTTTDNTYNNEESAEEEPATPPTLMNQQHQVSMEEVAAILGEAWYPQTLPPRKRARYRLGPNEVIDYARVSLKTAEDYENYHTLPKINFQDTEEDHEAALYGGSLLVYLTETPVGTQAGQQIGTQMGQQTDEDCEPVVEHIENVAADGNNEGGAR